MFETIFLIFVSIYFLITVFLISGIKKKFPKNINKNLPSVSVVIAARNEAENILECLTSLNKLIYSKEKLEIIIVDDFSTDSTGKIIDDYISDKPAFKKIIPEQSKTLRGKTNALASGIKKSKGEIIILTDADCKLPENWAATIASYYKNNVGMVNCFTTQSAQNIFSALQAIDLVYLLSVACGTTNNGVPISCIGNNMSFRKEAYLETGGYENIPFSVTEDFSLLKSIKKLKKYKIIFPLDQESLVATKPCKNFVELFRQKKRWAVGGLDINYTGLFIMLTAIASNLSIILTPLFFTPVSLYLAVFKISIDFFFLMLIHKSLGISKNLKYFLIFELYYILYTIALPVILLFNRSVIWKERKY